MCIFYPRMDEIRLLHVKHRMESYADKLSIPYAAFLGEDEIQQNKVTVKDLTTGQQQTVTAGEAVALVQAGLAARAGGTPIQEPEA